MSTIENLIEDHILIRRMIDVIKDEAAYIKNNNKYYPQKVEDFVKFVTVFADRGHHGKEENFLFKKLGEKTITPEHIGIIRRLNNEHELLRKNVSELVFANDRLKKGELKTLDNVLQILDNMVTTYYGHIERENTEIFPLASKYFSDEEMIEMLLEFKKIDVSVDKGRFQKLVDGLEETRPDTFG